MRLTSLSSFTLLAGSALLGSSEFEKRRSLSEKFGHFDDSVCCSCSSDSVSSSSIVTLQSRLY